MPPAICMCRYIGGFFTTPILFSFRRFFTLYHHKYMLIVPPSSRPHPIFQQEELTHPSSQSTHSVTVKPAFPRTDVNTLATSFKATNFIPTLSTYIHRLIPPLALPLLPNLMDCFDVYKCITILQPSKPAARFQESVD